jgi:23S rRNA A2030 N6-methylase RlmJ
VNYRHSFHAGNSADVVKHSLLITLVRALQQKPGALTLIDTHAGCGLYDLGGEQAQHYEKPSVKRARERAAAISRARKADRKRAAHDG